MSKNISNYFNLLTTEKVIFLNYLKARFPLFHNSNFFFRDFQYGIKSFFEKKNMKISYPDAEQLAIKMSALFESDGLFVRVNDQAWKINNPAFVTVKPGDPF